jgi:arginase
MDNHFILTPLFFDRYDEGLAVLAQSGWDINRPSLPEGDEKTRTMAVHRPLADLTAATLNRRKRPVSIAGDCCAVIPVMAGLQQGGINPALVWIDAHGDFNTWETTPGGFLGGMPLAMMVGLGEQTLVENVGMSRFPDQNIVLADGRDLDPEERDLIEKSNVVHLSNVLDLLNHSLPFREIYVHFDTDILDPSEASAMGYLARGGPPANDLEKVFRHLADTYKIVAVSMSTWRPNMDEDGRSKDICLRLLDALIGA